MLRKRLIPIVLTGCLLITCLPKPVYASKIDFNQSGEEDNDTMGVASIDIPATGEVVVTDIAATEPTAKELEGIITAVKSKITIPQELSEFNYDFYTANYNSSAYWYLNWSSKDYDKRITVQSDQKGNILYYYNNDGNNGNYAPKYLKAELKDNSDKFLKKTVAAIIDKLEYVEESSLDTYSGLYVYQYQRVENGIPMPDNMITVGVNYETGKVMSFSSSWLYNVEIPTSETKITKENAMEKIGKKLTMKLSYQNSYTTDKDGNTKIKAFLVYSPDTAYISVDAKTGEVYTTQNQWIEATANATKEDSVSGSADRGSLTEDEIEKVDEIKGLISKEKAIKAITENKSLLIDEKLNSITAKLYQQNNYGTFGEDTNYVWSISLSDPTNVNDETTDSYRAYAYAVVDAVTGDIISFQGSVKDYYNTNKEEWENVKVKYTLKQGQNVLEDFLKTQIPDKFKNTEFTDNKEGYVIALEDKNEVYGGYTYNYERVNEGVRYSYNGITGAVDGVTGKIYSFSYNWNNNVTFESPKGVITPENAFSVYMSLDGFHLVYEINNVHSYSTNKVITDNDYTVANEVRLVYRTDISPSYISPFTGKQLNYDGEEYVDNYNLYTYDDIGGIESSRNIKLLSDLGIGFKGGKFVPTQAITTKELTEFFSQAGIYYNNSKYEMKNDNTTITRLNVAKFSVQILGYDSVAKIKGIYVNNVEDADQIPVDYQGYTAIAQGLNLIKSNSNNELRPKDTLTRGEAADMLIAMLSVEN